MGQISRLILLYVGIVYWGYTEYLVVRAAEYLAARSRVRAASARVLFCARLFS